MADATTAKPTYWCCGQGHRFLFGDEEWHEEASQGRLEGGELIPMYCLADEETDEELDEPCMDSSSLIPWGL